jgi:hypothetical protein
MILLMSAKTPALSSDEIGPFAGTWDIEVAAQASSAAKNTVLMVFTIDINLSVSSGTTTLWVREVPQAHMNLTNYQSSQFG